MLKLIYDNPSEERSMRQPAVGINPKLLKWARETSGYSIEKVASTLKKEPESIRAWEAGTELPTYRQLEKLAYQLYKRPMALFFFPEPPDETQPSKSFRTLPKNEIDELYSDTLIALRKARAMQLALYELTDGHNPTPKCIFRDLKFSVSDNISQNASDVREYLQIPLDDQLAWKDPRQALNKWREATENVGIFVFKRALKQKEISGFCLMDEEFPIIYLNNSSTQTRQIFSLFHELAHILLRENGVTKSDITYVKSLTGQYKTIETFCNAFAAEFLVPSGDFSRFQQFDFHNDSEVGELAYIYKVSREVILRKALDIQLVDQNHYELKAREWASQANQKSKASGGGDYYRTQASYLGAKFINLAFEQYYQRHITREQLADYLNVKAKNLEHLDPLNVFRKSA
jgi:Zn-dependent peptidase ImmA (M78 family)/DNA-binding XRE family transcriptional regulator